MNLNLCSVLLLGQKEILLKWNSVGKYTAKAARKIKCSKLIGRWIEDQLQFCNKLLMAYCVQNSM